MRLTRSPAAREQARRLSRKTHTPAQLNPRGNGVKGLEMACRRGAMFSRLCALYSERVGSAAAESTPPGRSLPEEERLLRDIFGDRFWRDPLYRYAWPWAYRQWLLGDLGREIENIRVMLPKENRKRVDKELAQ